MKKIMMIIAALTAYSATFALDLVADTTETDTTYIRLKNKTLMIVSNSDADTTVIDLSDDEKVHKEHMTHWAGIDVGVNVLLTKNGNTNFSDEDAWLEQDYARSLSWNFNIFEEKIRIAKDYFGIATGVGLSYRSIGFKNNVQLTKTDSSLTGFTFLSDTLPNGYDESISYNKNKLRATYLTVPLMLEFNTNNKPEKNFHVGVGVIGGLRIGSIHKVKGEFDGEKIKNRRKNDFNLEDYSVDATVRIGYNDFTFWASYGLTPWFQTGKAPEVTMASAGIQLTGF